ncbi:MAG: hypothetical protein D6729_19635 [Deltaproteobacteria bacterium]|nr:MAG: hypothetical protein D6729_19635 [Deltaproteobacteria bacterium]
MRGPRILALGALLASLYGPALAASAQARAAESAAEKAPRRGFAEVERGLYVAGTFGGTVLLRAPTWTAGGGPVVPGLTMGVAVGYDVSELLQLELYGSGAQLDAPPDYQGLGAPTDPRGDFTAVQVGGRLRVAYAHFGDAQGIDRLYLNAYVGGGLLASEPSSYLERMGPAVSGGLGLRYHTRMRHFSVGIDLDLFYGLSSGALGLAPYGFLAYTF